ncbi:RNA polymerase sigma factor [Longirhabdus pacifica]|uniref:RNA polymerase sigma factor n=1 Tax=Longirhabdus pacifica TaxID=2305227 RepID=UPI001008CAB1|nr:RNA polymerase sigma factor [Longirhabdus pacifica]
MLNSTALFQNDKEQFLMHLYQQMFYVAYSKIRNKNDALDVVQEAWIKILNKIDTLKDEEKLVAWAKSITYHTALNMLKKKAREREQSDLIDLSYTISSNNSIEDQVIAYVVKESFVTFGEETERMMTYRYIDGYKSREIAEMMNIPEGTVKARLSRGRTKLRKMFD